MLERDRADGRFFQRSIGAWQKGGVPIHQGARDVFVVDMGHVVVGTQGQSMVRIAVQKGTSRVVPAHPE